MSQNADALSGLMTFPKPYADLVARLRVPSGFLLVATFAWFSRPDLRSLVGGVPVSILGLMLRGWAAGHLAKNRELATSGPYSYIRNPLYAGTLLVAAGLVIASRRWELALLFAAVFALVYLPVIQNEERHLRNIFTGYSAYAQRVPLLIPRGNLGRGTHQFEWRLYRKNKEFEAGLGFLAGLLLLVWKATS